jgi:hypothetical protein
VLFSGIGQWEQNSQIVHATAEDPLGPYTEQDTVAGVFAHEPCVTRDPRTGELLMVSVNYPVCRLNPAPVRGSSLRTAIAHSCAVLTPVQVEGKYSNETVFNSSGICQCTADCTRRAVGSRRKCSNPCPHAGLYLSLSLSLYLSLSLSLSATRFPPVPCNHSHCPGRCRTVDGDSQPSAWAV